MNVKKGTSSKGPYAIRNKKRRGYSGYYNKGKGNRYPRYGNSFRKGFSSYNKMGMYNRRRRITPFSFAKNLTVNSPNLKATRNNHSRVLNSSFLLKFDMQESYKYIPVLQVPGEPLILQNGSIKGICIPITGVQERIVQIDIPQTREGAYVRSLKRQRIEGGIEYEKDDVLNIESEDEIREEIREMNDVIEGKGITINTKSPTETILISGIQPILINFGVVIVRKGIDPQIILSNFRLPIIDESYLNGLNDALMSRTSTDYINHSAQIYLPSQDLLMFGTAALYWVNGSWTPHIIPKILSNSTPILNMGDQLVFIAKRTSFGMFSMSLNFSFKVTNSSN